MGAEIIEKRKKYKNNVGMEIDINSDKISPIDILQAKEVPIEIIHSGNLRKIGNKLVGCCPFHNEKTGSFTIFLDKNKFHCFGCSARADSIDYVMRRDNCGFIEAVKKLINK